MESLGMVPAALVALVENCRAATRNMVLAKRPSSFKVNSGQINSLALRHSEWRNWIEVLALVQFQMETPRLNALA
jgi:hypothetical protein